MEEEHGDKEEEEIVKLEEEEEEEEEVKKAPLSFGPAYIDNDTWVIAFDFESFGPIPHVHGFTQLGAVLGRLSDGQILFKFNEYAKQDGFEMDSKCYEGFWKLYPEIYEYNKNKCTESALTCKDVCNKFAKFCEEVLFLMHSATGGSKKNIYLITDCATYDTALLKAFCDKDMFTIFGGARDIVDITMFMLGSTQKPLTSERIDASTSGLFKEKYGVDVNVGVDALKHDAVCDAESIFLKWKKVNDVLSGSDREERHFNYATKS